MCIVLGKGPVLFWKCLERLGCQRPYWDLWKSVDDGTFSRSGAKRTLPEGFALSALCLIRTGIRSLSINGAVKTTNLSKNTVRGAMQELRANGFLQDGGEILTPSPGREPKSGPAT